MLCIAWQYLTGRAVATDPVDRRRAEWPPHPDRVFQALVAAWGERGEAADERAALEWLCGLPAPEITAPLAGPEADDSTSVFLPNVVKVFVPAPSAAEYSTETSRFLMVPVSCMSRASSFGAR